MVGAVSEEEKLTALNDYKHLIEIFLKVPLEYVYIYNILDLNTMNKFKNYLKRKTEFRAGIHLYIWTEYHHIFEKFCFEVLA